MNREHLIIAGGSLVIGLLVLANIQQVRENTSDVVHTQTEIGQILPRSETVLATPKTVTVPASKISPSAGNQTFQTREEIQRQVALIEADFKRSTSQTAKSAGTLFRGMDMDQYLRDLADSRNISGNAGGSQAANLPEEDEISKAFVRWIQSDPEAAKEWALSQNLQPVMTTLLRAGSDFAVSEAFESSKLWIDGIQESDLKEVAAWNFSEGYLRSDPEAGKTFLDGTDWLSPHAKGRVTALASKN